MQCNPWVQQAGASVMAEDELQKRVFERGEMPPSASGERELVVAEVDGTFNSAQDGEF